MSNLNREEYLENLNEMLHSLNNYYEMCEENLMGNEELIPNIGNEENFDKNYLSFLKS